MTERRKFDTYLTPDDACAALSGIVARRVRPVLRPFGAADPLAVLEPAAGPGRLIPALQRGLVCPRDALRVTVVDRDAAWRRYLTPLADEVHCPEDFLFWSGGRSACFDLVVGNPPYGELALPFVQRAEALLRPGGVMLYLLRLAFWESRDRAPWLAEHLPWGQAALAKRPGFVGTRNTDMAAYAWFAWRAAPGPQWMELIPWPGL